MSYYHDFEENIPESFKLLNLLEDMNSNHIHEKEKPLKPIPECILSYYQPFVNKLFFDEPYYIRNAAVNLKLVLILKQIGTPFLFALN